LVRAYLIDASAFLVAGNVGCQRTEPDCRPALVNAGQARVLPVEWPAVAVDGVLLGQ
jgi:hypothetical protein